MKFFQSSRPNCLLCELEQGTQFFVFESIGASSMQIACKTAKLFTCLGGPTQLGHTIVHLLSLFLDLVTPTIVSVVVSPPVILSPVSLTILLFPPLSQIVNSVLPLKATVSSSLSQQQQEMTLWLQNI